jgi:hypothetical protein
VRVRLHVQSFLEGIRLRDTHERRTLCYGNKAVAVAFDLLRLICAHNTRLLEALRQAGTDHNAIARAFLKFAPAEKCVLGLYTRMSIPLFVSPPALSSSCAMHC